MHILLLGGTRFVGRHLVQEALARGHTITLFNRGKTDPQLFPNVETRIGDRDGGLKALEDGTWDAVIDTCGYLPRIVGDSARLLHGRVEQYVFISSISVYADPVPGADEDAPLDRTDDPTTEEITETTYGPLKVLCEQTVQQVFGDRALIVRPGLIVGPDDHTDRFTYWPVRILAGGEILAPGNPEQQVQFIDVRDLASWILNLVEREVSGVFHATGPAQPLPMRSFLQRSLACLQPDASLTWLPEDFLHAQGVEPWSDLPLWVGAQSEGISAVNLQRALSAGLALRPLEETLADTLEWHRTRPEFYALKAGMTHQREQQVLEAWHMAQNAG